MASANEYVVRAEAHAPALHDTHGAPEGWGSLPAELQEEILQHVCVEVSVREEFFRKRPDDMAAGLAQYPFLTVDMAAFPRLFAVTQEFVISRARQPSFRAPFRDIGRLLTIQLSERVERRRLNPAISAADAGRLCARVDRTERWSGVSRLRLREERRLDSAGVDVGYPFCVFEFVRRGPDGAEETVAAPRRFALQGRLQKRRLRDRLVEELGLRHAVVDGVAEFWC
jgi:hypothetical protein